MKSQEKEMHVVSGIKYNGRDYLAGEMVVIEEPEVRAVVIKSGSCVPESEWRLHHPQEEPVPVEVPAPSAPPEPPKEPPEDEPAKKSATKK